VKSGAVSSLKTGKECAMRRIIFLMAILLSVLLAIAGCSPSPADTTPPVSEGYITVDDGLRLYYRTVGDGPETVIIPGACWLADVLDDLAQGRTLIFYDSRGRGYSDAIEDVSLIGYDFFVEDLEAIRQHFGKDQVSLFGHSYIAGTVALYAAQYPEHVNRMILLTPISPHYAISGLRPANFNVDMEAVMDILEEEGVDQSDSEAYECRFNLLVDIAPYIIVDPAKLDLIDLSWCDLPNEWPAQSDKWWRHFWYSLGDWDWRDEVASLTVTTLVIHADRDAPLEGPRIWASRPNARLLVIEGASHQPWIDRPDIFLPAVDLFLSGEWPESAEVVE
jgi:pimeloyl-ACP methyl ester carboxylesterase